MGTFMGHMRLSTAALDGGKGLIKGSNGSDYRAKPGRKGAKQGELQAWDDYRLNEPILRRYEPI
jgi:hypothetical protein